MTTKIRIRTSLDRDQPGFIFLGYGVQLAEARIIHEVVEFFIENVNIISVGIILLSCFVYKQEIKSIVGEMRSIEPMKPLKNGNEFINLEFNDIDVLKENSYIYKPSISYIDYNYSWCHLFYTSLSGSGHITLPMISFFLISMVFFHIDKSNCLIKYKPQPYYEDFYDKAIIKVEKFVNDILAKKIKDDPNLVITLSEVNTLINKVSNKTMCELFEHKTTNKHKECIVNPLNLKYFKGLEYNTYILKLLSRDFNVDTINPNLILTDDDVIFLQISHYKSLRSLCNNPRLKLYNINTILYDLNSLRKMHQTHMYIQDISTIYSKISVKNNLSAKIVFDNLPSCNKREIPDPHWLLPSPSQPYGIPISSYYNLHHVPKKLSLNSQINSTTNNGYKYWEGDWTKRVSLNNVTLDRKPPRHTILNWDKENFCLKKGSLRPSTSSSSEFIYFVDKTDLKIYKIPRKYLK